MGQLTNSYATTPVSEQDASKVATYNAALQILDDSINGQIDIAVTTADVTLTGTPAAPQAQHIFLNVTGALTGNRSILIPVAAGTGRNRIYVVKNGTSGAFTLTVKKVGGTGVTVTQGKIALLLYDGSDITHAITDLATLGAAAWPSWTPTWTNLTIGNAVVTAKYVQIGKLVLCRLDVVFGTTTSVSGDVRFSMPVTRATYGGTSGIAQLGVLSAYDVSVTTAVQGCVINISTTEAMIRIQTAGGTYVNLVALSSTVPFTWTTSDEIHTEFFYEAA